MVEAADLTCLYGCVEADVKDRRGRSKASGPATKPDPALTHLRRPRVDRVHLVVRRPRLCSQLPLDEGRVVLYETQRLARGRIPVRLAQGEVFQTLCCGWLVG